jgi:hypothetical protein
MPISPSTDPAVVPRIEQAFPLQHPEVGHQTVFPGFVFVAVAEKD